MSQDLGRLPAFDAAQDCVNVVVETPRMARGKFKYEPALGGFTLHKVLPLGFAFPYDFGFIPSTKGEDGDPLDVLLLLDVPVPMGTIVKTRLIGAIEAMQTQVDGRRLRNDRLLGKAIVEGGAVTDITQLPPGLVDSIEAFFTDYDRRQGKRFEPLARRDAAGAIELVKAGA